MVKFAGSMHPECEPIFYNHLTELFLTSQVNGNLEFSDLGSLPSDASVISVHEKFLRQYADKNNSPMIWTPLFKTIGSFRFFISVLLRFIMVGGSFAQPLLLETLTKYQQGQISLSPLKKWILISLVLAIPVMSAACKAHSESYFRFFGVQVRNALNAEIYKKTLVLNPTARAKYSSAEISNLFTQDTEFVERFLSQVSNIVLFPLQIGASLVLIYYQVGNAMFVGFAYIIGLFPFLLVVSFCMEHYLKRYMGEKDVRLAELNEVISGIRIVKNYAWEEAFCNSILNLRKAEMVSLVNVANIWNIAQILFASIPVVLPMVVFYAYVRLGHDLQLSVAFTTLMLFGIIQEPVMWLPSVAQSAVQANTAAQRIKTFLLAPPSQKYVHGRSTSLQVNSSTLLSASVVGEVEGSCTAQGGRVVCGGSAVRLCHCSFSWKEMDNSEGTVSDRFCDKSTVLFDDIAGSTSPGKVPEGSGSGSGYEMVRKIEDTDFSQVSDSGPANIISNDIETGPEAPINNCILKDISLEVQSGQLVAICGSVGSGKSSLLNALLGDMVKVSGDKVEVHGSIAYHQQQPWILSATIQDNIVLGRELDMPKLKAVLKACGLDVDIKSMADGLSTEIGEKGINLSGGQKARISLARCLYSDADIYLLDDPLSAVDATVSTIIFQEGIKKYLRSKTVILVTHQVQYLKDCDMIAIIETGRIVAQGSYAELNAIGVNVDAISAEVVAKTKPDELPSLGRARASSSGRSTAPPPSVYSHPISANSDAASRAVVEGQAITASDELLAGSVKLSTYWMYLKDGGVHLYVIVVFLALGTVVSSIAGDYYLSEWGEAANDTNKKSGYSLSNSENITYLQNYAWRKCIGIGTNALVFFFGLRHSFRVGNKVHSTLLTTVLGATIAYFDTTPQGRIFTRFSNYLTEVDTTLIINTLMTLTGLAALLGALGSIAYSTRGIFLILLIPLAYPYTRIYQSFTKTNTEVRRLHNLAMGPLQTEFQQAVYGVSSIRAYCAEDMFRTKMIEKLSTQSTCLLLMHGLNSWLTLRLDILGATISFFIYVIAFGFRDLISSGNFVVAVFLSSSIPSLLSMLIYKSSELEASFTSLEKIQHDIETIEQEETRESREDWEDGDDDWPQSGEIVIEGLQMGYRDLPPVLRNVTISIKDKEKIGICGRTGSGKSSLMVALFRIENLRDGKIVIDGMDIADMPLRKLRSKVVIIPQDAVLFAKTVRFNVDPFDWHSDDEIWTALTCVNLHETVRSLSNQLNEKVSEGGANFSAGQRQLFCFARALLRNPKIIVLDEATASVDNSTDAFIQSMIAEKFADCTILTIAHRLNTIMNCDRILVLDQGKVAEYDTPHHLLNIPNGIFKSMWSSFESSHS